MIPFILDALNKKHLKSYYLAYHVSTLSFKSEESLVLSAGIFPTSLTNQICVRLSLLVSHVPTLLGISVRQLRMFLETYDEIPSARNCAKPRRSDMRCVGALPIKIKLVILVMTRKFIVGGNWKMNGWVGASSC
jgi:hypothetical protein